MFLNLNVTKNSKGTQRNVKTVVHSARQKEIKRISAKSQYAF